ncbi:MAG: helix-turn-helix transcriptional regulator [Candidatus Eisenbacteria bacterium]|uniref:Helix-turn-helix transcriptional regulator n=1 Tax=Eiseniibacteriota bacterium TaxID=2212470 RepID=A0A849SJJ9_UNCEI|nr:helix-turn-helix transcriptional regulator [Candidatus Eisenbacteria bacterium]
MQVSQSPRSNLASGQFLGLRVEAARFGGFAVGVHIPTVPPAEVATHDHADAHFVLVLAGHYRSTARGWQDDAALPALIYNPPGTTHRDRFERCAGGRFLTISFAADEALIETSRSCAREPNLAPPHGAALARRLTHHLADGSDSARLAGESVCLELIELATRSPSRRAGREKAWIRAVCDRLRDERERAPTMAEVARSLDLHPVYLAREFRRAIGCSPGDYLRHYRLERAAALLAHSRQSLAEIALQCGFADQSHCARQFKAAFGASPSAYRRRLGGVARVQDAAPRLR